MGPDKEGKAIGFTETGAEQFSSNLDQATVYYQDLLALETEYYEEKLALEEEKLKEAEKLLDFEMQARANGYAYDMSLAEENYKRQKSNTR